MTAQGAIDPKDVVRFAEEAKLGDHEIYAWSDSDFPRSLPGVKAARRLAEQGMLTFASRRSPGRIEYVMYRVAKRKREAAKIIRSEKGETVPETIVFAMLDRAATARPPRPCPSNREIEDELLSSGITLCADYVIRKLKLTGKIRTERVGPGQRRVVTIASSGRRTAMAMSI